jgi:hypothetical protein
VIAVAVALIVLCGRALAYALVDDPLAHATGGPALPVVIVVSGVLALGASSAVLWLAALGVNERRLLEPHAVAPSLRLRPLRAVLVFGLSVLAFALVESYLHWRAGLGFHGLECLFGPVHRDALPILAALSMVATAVAAAVEHVIAWMRRTLARLRRGVPRRRRAAVRFLYVARAGRPRTRPLSARGPPEPGRPAAAH